MSATSAWSYTNTATIKPFESIDSWTQETVYGDEYIIDCTWEAEANQERDNDGAEFTSRHIIYTEDDRPKRLDMIQLDGHDDWEEIRSVTQWDMSFFDETPDYKVVT